MTTKSETKTATRADLHCHSTASAVSKLGVQRALGLPECATPPEEVYALAKRRGMDFVTITDHDTIDGVLEIADRPDVFVSEELTARFAGEPQAVHVLCLGITPDDHEWLQAHADDVEQVAEYLREQEIASALAHPFYAVEAPLTARHRRRLAELFGVWEVRNGARAPELNAPAAVYVDTHGGTGVGGSDDHAGVDIGRTWTEAPAASTPREFLDHLRAGRVDAHGEQGSAAKWAHAAMAIALRTLRPQRGRAARPRGRAADGRARHGGGRRPQRRAGRRHRPRRLPRAAARLAGGDRPRPAAARAARADCRPTTSATPSCTAAPATSTSASCRPRSAGCWRSRPRAPAATGAPPPRRSSRRASRRCRTRPRPPSSARRSASSPAPTATRRASRWWPTASARPTASRARSRSCGSAEFRASRST